MKKKILLLLLIILTTGCTNIKMSNPLELIDEATESNNKIYNTYRNGYKFYVPLNLEIESSRDFNEIIKSKDYKYYMYIDLVSYLNKSENTYEVNDDAYLSKIIKHGDTSGYIEINLENDKYLVEIMYNYAKIEVIVDEDDINSAVANSIIILSSIYYNDNILNNLEKETVLSYSEENIDIFKSDNGSKETSSILQVIAEIDKASDEENSNKVPDYDLIKK